MGDSWDAAYITMGYVWCRPHEEWHRPPECAINEQGQPLMPCGCIEDHEYQTASIFHREECDLDYPVD